MNLGCEKKTTDGHWGVKSDQESDDRLRRFYFESEDHVESDENGWEKGFATLQGSSWQFVPGHITGSCQTSEVFDFSYDFNFAAVRNDTNNTSMRIMFTGVGARHTTDPISGNITPHDVAARYIAPIVGLKPNSVTFEAGHIAHNDTITIRQELNDTLFRCGENCDKTSAVRGRSVRGTVKGEVDAEFSYSFSMLATLGSGTFNVVESNGSFTVDGKSNLTYSIGGMGSCDLSKAAGEETMFGSETFFNPHGHGCTKKAGGSNGWIAFEPSYGMIHTVTSLQEAGENYYSPGHATIVGALEVQVVTDLAAYTASFPRTTKPADKVANHINNITIPSTNILYGSGPISSKFEINQVLVFTLGLDFSFFNDLYNAKVDVLQMEMTYYTTIGLGSVPGHPERRELSCAEYDIEYVCDGHVSEEFNEADQPRTIVRQRGHGGEWAASEDELGKDRQQPPAQCYITHSKYANAGDDCPKV